MGVTNLQEPHDSLGLRKVQMVQFQRHYGSLLVFAQRAFLVICLEEFDT